MRSTKKYTTVKIALSLLCALLIITCLNGCKKEVNPILPDNKEVIELNFYPASDVLSAYAVNTYTGIYVDHYIMKPVWGGSNTLSAFFFFSANGSSDFPQANTHSNSRDPAVVIYNAYNAGGHRLMFADTTNTVVLDTSINQPTKSHTCLYFTDAMTADNAPAAYKMIAVQEDRTGIAPEKVGIRFVHLSADAGPLACSLQKADGSLVNALDADLNFGEASPYRYYAAKDTVGGLIRFSLNNPANGAKIITGLPYNPGKTYVIVISGFNNDQRRQISIGKNTDGSIKYKSITVSRNLRTAIRRTY